MNRKYFPIILAGILIGACFSMILFSKSNVILAYADSDTNRYYNEGYHPNEEYEDEDGGGYYDHYESGLYEDKYGKPYYK
jgi:hypothetical protein